MVVTSKTITESTLVSANHGDLLYFDGTSWIRLPAGEDGYVLVTHDLGNDPTWEAAASGDPSGPAGGDLNGTFPNPGVAKVHGATVPIAGSLTTGNVLQVNGTSSLTYGAVNLAGGSNYVTGTLPAGNQAAQTVSGDLSGSTSSATVTKIQNITVNSTTPSNGQVLTYSTADAYWYPATPSNSGGSSAGFIAPVRAVADTNIALSGLQTIGGVVLGDGYRVAVIGQTTAFTNGIYSASSGSWTRVSDLNTGSQFIPGMIIPVSSDDMYYGGEILRFTTSGSVTIGATALNFRSINTRNRRTPITGTQWHWKLDGASDALTNIGSQDSSVLVKTGSTIFDTVNDGGQTPDGSDSILGTGCRYQSSVGGTAYLSVTSAGNPTNTSNFATSMWITVGAVPTVANSLIFGRMNSTVSVVYAMYVALTTSGRIEFFLQAGGATTTSTTYTLTQGVPYFVECSYDGSFQRVTVNGTEVTTGGGSANSGAINWSTGQWFVFNKPVSTSGNNEFNGTVEDVKVYSPRTGNMRAVWHKGLGRLGRF